MTGFGFDISLIELASFIFETYPLSAQGASLTIQNLGFMPITDIDTLIAALESNTATNEDYIVVSFNIIPSDFGPGKSDEFVRLAKNFISKDKTIYMQEISRTTGRYKDFVFSNSSINSIDDELKDTPLINYIGLYSSNLNSRFGINF